MRATAWLTLCLAALVPIPARVAAKKSAQKADNFQAVGNKAMSDFSAGALS